LLIVAHDWSFHRADLPEDHAVRKRAGSTGPLLMSGASPGVTVGDGGYIFSVSQRGTRELEETGVGHESEERIVKSVARDELRRMLGEGVQLIDVLPPNEFDEDHLPGAINIPLRRIDGEARDRLDPAKAVVVYCWDGAWDLSPRAACRLETLGFTDVYDYTAGKLDWLAAGLPFEGSKTARIGALAKKDVPTSALKDRLGDVVSRAQNWGLCVVLEDGIVLGLLGQKELASDPESLVEQVMRPGTSTFRPHVPVAEMAAHMVEHKVEWSLVTTSEGRLVGVVARDEVVHAAHGEHEGHEHGW
jgi:rhodanese-related sulfurtransferase